MTVPVALPEQHRVPQIERLRALAAVAGARLLARSSPKWIEQVLGVVARACRRAATEQEAERARHTVVSSSELCAGQYCLQRSIAIVLLLGTRRRAVTLCTGVRPRPLAAHAWVEVGGLAVGEGPGIGEFHRTLVIPAR